mmetsp:Transcript_11944/g.13588  ORF Transcript_11944/g.13588 Transcript_11944/m.13588 type:complete len:216 (-) Transcript_11944:813-1460(-)
MLPFCRLSIMYHNLAQLNLSFFLLFFSNPGAEEACAAQSLDCGTFCCFTFAYPNDGKQNSTNDPSSRHAIPTLGLRGWIMDPRVSRDIGPGRRRICVRVQSKLQYCVCILLIGVDFICDVEGNGTFVKDLVAVVEPSDASSVTGNFLFFTFLLLFLPTLIFFPDDVVAIADTGNEDDDLPKLEADEGEERLPLFLGIIFRFVSFVGREEVYSCCF